MSGLVSPRTRITRSSAAPKKLRLVVAPKKKGRTPFVAIVIFVVTIGMTGLIFLSTVLQAQAFQVAQLNKQATTLQAQQDAMTNQVDHLKSPAGVAAAALAMGMVPNQNPVFLRLSDGKVIGKAAPALPDTNVKRVDQ